jgi:site-specific DNA recombinase
MKVAIYARVSSESQQARGSIGSQLEVLRTRIAGQGDELVAEFCDDGYSGARLDRPGLDALRDQAEAGAFDTVWCLSPDRLARAYVYQVVVLDELAAFGVRVLFHDAPVINDDPQARLLTQMQGVIAEYERDADIGISLVMPSPRLCRLDRSLVPFGLLTEAETVHQVGITTAA